MENCLGGRGRSVSQNSAFLEWLGLPVTWITCFYKILIFTRCQHKIESELELIISLPFQCSWQALIECPSWGCRGLRCEYKTCQTPHKIISQRPWLAMPYWCSPPTRARRCCRQNSVKHSTTREAFGRTRLMICSNQISNLNALGSVICSFEG